MSMRFKKVRGTQTRRDQGYRDGYLGRPFRYNTLKKERRKQPHSSSNTGSDKYFSITYSKAYSEGVKARQNKDTVNKFLKGLVFIITGLFVTSFLLSII